MFSLFSVVTFQNLQCTVSSDTSLRGTCLSSTECSDEGGRADGNCASGFGVCCLQMLTGCGGTITKNCTYFQNTGFPTAVTTTQTCAYNINPVSDNICSIRLDFNNLVVAAPTGAGVCTGGAQDQVSFDSPTGTALPADPPVICGTNTGQHLYIDQGQSSTASVVTLTLGTGTSSRTYRIKATQIECDSPVRPPGGCVQYYTGTSGTTMSYNFAGGQNLQTQNFGTCIRRAEGFCDIEYRQSSITMPDPFAINVAAAIATSAISCTIAAVVIPREPTGAGTFCGGSLNTMNAATTGGVIRQSGAPFMFATRAEAQALTGATGYSIDFNQISC